MLGKILRTFHAKYSVSRRPRENIARQTATLNLKKKNEHRRAEEEGGRRFWRRRVRGKRTRGRELKRVDRSIARISIAARRDAARYRALFNGRALFINATSSTRNERLLCRGSKLPVMDGSRAPEGNSPRVRRGRQRVVFFQDAPINRSRARDIADP